MAIYLGIHNMGVAMAEDKMQGSWEAYKSACAKLGMSAKHCHMSPEQGKAFCLTEADSADLITMAHDEAGVPVDEVIEVIDFN
ncbi:MAG TPA: nickel-binding protein [Candidatus Saccharimonadales bacterium]|nr:nickel-binding protein [Candidatus Saccharimonadales bacterium]